MKLTYNLIAGQSLERLAALSDGVFSIVITLLVLDLRVPVLEVTHVSQPLWADGALQSEQVLWTALLALAPRLLAYALSFLTLGIFWIGHQTLLNYLQRSNRALAWLNLIFLLAVSLLPFTTSLLAEYITFRLALLIYWVNLLFLGVMIYVNWRYVQRAALLKEGVSEEVLAATIRRVVVYQILYAFGAALCVISTYLSIGFIVLVQLNVMLAPRIRGLNRF